MGVIVIEGVVITILVVLGLREAIMNAVPLALKRSIGVGIGLFILFIGLANGGLIAGSQSAYGSVPPVGLRPITEVSQWVFLLGVLITFVLFALRVKAALIISILATSVVAFITGVTSAPAQWTVTPKWDTLFQPDLVGAINQVALITAILTIFAIMLSDFFDTMGTVTGIAAEAGLAERRRLRPRHRPGPRRRLPGRGRRWRRGRQLQHHLHRVRRRRGRRWQDRAGPPSSPASCSWSRSCCHRSRASSRAWQPPRPSFLSAT